jgi:IS30 family transposase
METDIAVHFCDPQRPWQRGSNENTNRLLRQYFPKGMDLAPHSQAEVNRIARRLNERPQKLWTSIPRQRALASVLRRPIETAVADALLGVNASSTSTL